MDANFSTMTMPKTMPAQHLLRYISFKGSIPKELEGANKVWTVDTTLIISQRTVPRGNDLMGFPFIYIQNPIDKKGQLFIE